MENIKDLKLIIGPLNAEQWKEVTDWCDKTSTDCTKFRESKCYFHQYVKFTYTQTEHFNCYSDNYPDYKRITYQQWYDRFIKKSKVLPKNWYLRVTNSNLKFLKDLPNYKHLNLGDWSSITSINSGCDTINVPRNYTEISFEDFKELVLELNVKQNKEEIMNKQEFTIEGCEALRKAFVEECGIKTRSDTTISNQYSYLYPTVDNILQGHNIKADIHFILPQDWTKALEYVKEYFKEEPTFKVGQWIYRQWKFKDSDIDIFQIKGIYETQYDITDSYYRNGKLIQNGTGKCFIEDDKFTDRLATPEEIKSVQTKTLVLGDKKIKVEISRGEIWAENRKLSIELVNEALTLMSLETALHNNNTGWTITFPSIKIGCTVLSLDEVKLIKKTYKELND
jgi:hypothetical protein